MCVCVCECGCVCPRSGCKTNSLSGLETKLGTRKQPTCFSQETLSFSPLGPRHLASSHVSCKDTVKTSTMTIMFIEHMLVVHVQTMGADGESSVIHPTSTSRLLLYKFNLTWLTSSQHCLPVQSRTQGLQTSLQYPAALWWWTWMGLFQSPG